jgi:hypothetical protein
MPEGMGDSAAEWPHIDYGSRSKLGWYWLRPVRIIMCDAKRAAKPVKPVIPALPARVVPGTVACRC